MRIGVCTNEDIIDIKVAALDLCHEMHCGDPHGVEAQRLALYQRYGQQGWLLHAVLLAELAEEYAPERVRDLTGAVSPHKVLDLNEGVMRDSLRAHGMSPAQLENALEHNRRAITHVTNLLACAHIQEGFFALAELEKAFAHHLDTLTATATLVLRVAAFCVPCPRTENHP